jgi:hypothetical protein
MKHDLLLTLLIFFIASAASQTILRARGTLNFESPTTCGDPLVLKLQCTREDRPTHLDMPLSRHG